MTISDKIRTILKNASWSQEELARRLNVSFKTLNSWLSEKSSPRSEHYDTLNTLYNDIVGRTAVDAEYLKNTETAALATHIDLAELLENQVLLDTTTLYLTYHTNTIEGSTMTLADVEKIFTNDNIVIKDKTLREQQEALNHRSAFLYLLSELKSQGKNFRWTTDLIKNTHLRLMNGIIESAGSFRTHGVRILGSHVTLANYLSVPQKIDNLTNYMNTPSRDDIIKKMAITHATFEQIHPFGDGNGRTGRLIMFIQALHYGIVPPLVIKERKRAYYKYLELAQLKEEYDLLRLFIAESILTTNDLIK